MKKILLSLSLLVVAFVCAQDAVAAPDGEYIFTSSGGFRLASITAQGPVLIEMLANGDATSDIVDTIDGSGTDPNTARRVWPSGDYGNSTFALRDGQPRPFVTQGTGADSVTVILGTTATEVIVTWTNVQ